MKKEDKSKVLNDEKELTDTQIKRLKEFNKIREKLLEEGYKEKNLTSSILKANIMVLVTTGPIAIICYVLYLMINGMNYESLGLEFILIFLLGIIIHELIHGATWAAFCEKKWEAVGFGVDWSTFTPYCCCNEGLRFKEYVLGVIMPTIVVGILPYIAGLILGNYFWALFGIVHIIAGGGDAYILWLIRKEKNSIMVDHPYLIGCVAFEK